MKKIFLPLLSLVLAAVIVNWWFNNEESTNLSDKPLPVEASTLLEGEASEPLVPDVAVTQEGNKKNDAESLPVVNEQLSEGCNERLAKQFPELERRFNLAFENLYFSEQELAGEGVYQGMTLDELKSLADSNDNKAMLIYGSESIWRSALGVSFSGYDARYRTPEETRQIVKNHRVDLAGVADGESYLFKAAVFGKEGAIFEATSLLDMVASQVNRKGAEQDKVISLLARSIAYKQLLNDIHQHDPVLQQLFADPHDQFNGTRRLFAEQDNYPEIEVEVARQAERLYQELSQRWLSEREYYGFDVYPDYFTGELEEYAEQYFKCQQ